MYSVSSRLSWFAFLCVMAATVLGLLLAHEKSKGIESINFFSSCLTESLWIIWALFIIRGKACCHWLWSETPNHLQARRMRFIFKKIYVWRKRHNSNAWVPCHGREVLHVKSITFPAFSIIKLLPPSLPLLFIVTW